MDTVKRDFDKEASTWETPPRIKLAHDVAGAMLGRVALSRDMDVLDFGCGTGLIAMQFARHVRSVTGIDTSKGMLEVFKDKAKKASQGNIKTAWLDLTDSTDIDGKYHLITSSMTLHHVKDTKKILGQFHRALLPGGRIALADLDTENGLFHDNNEGVFHFGFDRTALKRLCEGTGFTDIVVSTAARMHKPGTDGQTRSFDIFLITGRKE